MLKIIIVEDEDIIRKGLVYTIDWLSMGCIIIADASNGEEGLNKIIELQPDVVITDIKMPCIDGITMIRRALEYTKFKTVILTSYTEFDYAKQAIEIKASNYLVKPVDEAEIKKVINLLREEIEEEKETELLRENSLANEKNIDLNYYMNLGFKENGYVSQATQRIQECYTERISIETIADEMGVSSSYLSRKFKEVTNHTFLDLLNKYRIQQAIKLLGKEHYRISEISDMVGFTDYKHFCNVFKRYTLMSPKEFRELFL